MNTVNFFNREGEAILRPLAEENNGVYRFIPPPVANQIPDATAGGKPAPVTQ